MLETFSSLLKVASKLILSLLIVGGAKADLFTYTYTGPDFNTYYENFQAVNPLLSLLGYNNISANVSLSQPLGSNAFLLEFSGVNILGADRLVQWGINGTTNQGELELGTDASGGISYWYLATYLTPPLSDNPGNQVTLFETTPGFDEIFRMNDAGSQSVVVTDSIGTWATSVTPTPEPAARPTLKAGMLLTTVAYILSQRRKGIARAQ